MPYKDREKGLKYCKKWREDNKEKLREEYKSDKNGTKTRKKLRGRKKRLFYIEEKLQLKCCKCGENHVACLEFHHLDTKEKEKSISKMVKHSWEKIKKEMKKCIVLCSNCHRKEHWDDNRIEKLKKEIIKLEIKNNKKIKERQKKDNCRMCGKNRSEIEFVKRRHFCKNCYREYQKNKMKERRKPE